jgi:four helix bundle protein
LAKSQQPIANQILSIMRNFRELTIWQNAISLAKNIYSLVEILPAKEKYGLASQICRAAVSIPSNIAEGCSRSSQKEFKHYLEIGFGSAFEVETQLIIIAETEMIEKGRISETISKIHSLQAQINALIGKLK